MHMRARDGLCNRFGLSIGMQQGFDLRFSLFFFSKELGKPEVEAMGGGGDRRVHASGANLDLCPAGCYYFYYCYYFYHY